MNQNGLEIERKYLIRMPDEGLLSAMPGCETWEVVQTYLMDGPDGSTHRVRSILTRGETHYIHTIKRPLSQLSHEEWEQEVSLEEYESLLKDANPALHPIVKKRYRIPHAGQLLEIDVYDFWQDRATLEIELTSEEEQVSIPDWLHIVRELTGERAYKNRFLAECVPMEEI
jgi:CYTH domain-containing protein